MYRVITSSCAMTSLYRVIFDGFRRTSKIVPDQNFVNNFVLRNIDGSQKREFDLLEQTFNCNHSVTLHLTHRSSKSKVLF